MDPPLKKILSVIALLSYCVITFNCFADQPKQVRVLIMPDAASFNLKVNGSYEVQDSLSGKILYRGRELNTTAATYSTGILIGEVNADTNKIFIKPTAPEAITINGRRFRGNIQLIKKDNARLAVVNYIELEDYIKGILYHEVSHHWPQEALKAQAIACRTFALYQIQENTSRDYDVTSDIYSQVYGGRTSERYRTTKAVDETKSEVLTYADKIFPAYYHATCAGHTENAFLLWNIDIAPLKGVPCVYCKESPHFNWHLVLSKEEVRDALIKSGYNGFKEIKNIIILAEDVSGRVREVKVITDKKEIKISGKDFRNSLGPNVINSLNFKVDVVDDDVVFIGFGWGHGVGMCQWGAYFMAKDGYKYQDILKYYYPGADVKTF